MDEYTSTTTIVQTMDEPNLRTRRHALQALTTANVIALVDQLVATRPHLYRDAATAYRAIRLQAEPELWDIEAVEWIGAPGYVAYYGGGALAWYPHELGQREIACKYLTQFFDARWPREYADYLKLCEEAAHA